MEIEIILSSDLNYDNLVAEIYIEKKYIALVGYNNDFEFFVETPTAQLTNEDTINHRVAYPLFVKALEKARQRLEPFPTEIASLKNQPLQNKCLQLLSLLNKVGESCWYNYFNELLQKDLENYTLAKQILSLSKGMGSFNDLILSFEGHFLAEENELLGILRKELFEIASAIVIEHHNASKK